MSVTGKSVSRLLTAATLLTLVVTFVVAPTPASSPASAPQLVADVVASGLEKPLAFVQDPSQAKVQVILEKAGRVRVLQNDVLLAEPFLDITYKVASPGEQGLLGLAFAPDYASSGRLFVTYSNLEGNTVIARFIRSGSSPLRADPGSEFDLVWPDGNAFISQPGEGHKGGNLAFGPDGMLYIGLGDGNWGGDPDHLAQDPGSLLGKILRLNVSVPDGDPEGYDVPAGNPFVGQGGILPEIWAFGLRNPWRWSFDDPTRGGTGALVIADVGEHDWEEVDYEPAGRGGRNYGWRLREGAHDFVTDLPPFFGPATDPIYEYGHGTGRSIIGGFVYRGTALGPSFNGRYFHADWVSGRVWSLGLNIDGSGEASAGDLLDHSLELGLGADAVASFGVDANGELYTVSYNGAVYRIRAAAAAPPPLPPSSGDCLTPDPFVALGGGICIGGGWHPPGTTPPTTPPPSTPPPTTPPPTAPPPASSCTTPDPFAALGGGTCYDGGWLPPGMTPPTAPPPTTPPPTTPPPTSPPPTTPPTGGCATPDPFAAIGGGTCYDGGWLPPGMTPPGAPPPSPPPPPGTPPPAPPPSGGCTTPDPFVGIPGLIGRCIDGGWMPISGVDLTGRMQWSALELGGWVIVADDGRVFAPWDLVPSAFRIDGLRVRFRGTLPSDRVSSRGIVIDLLEITVL